MPTKQIIEWKLQGKYNDYTLGQQESMPLRIDPFPRVDHWQQPFITAKFVMAGINHIGTYIKQSQFYHYWTPCNIAWCLSICG